MATAVVMPKQGQSVESCIIVEWKKQVGEAVAVGDALCDVETDKATMEVPSPVAGVLLAQTFEAGADVPVLTTIAWVGQPGEKPDGAGEQPAALGGVTQPDAPAEPAHQPAQVIVEPPAAVALAVAISPRARNLAQHKRLDVSGVSGSGPGGRIIERDVQAALANQPKLTPVAKAMLAEGGYALPGQGSGLGGRITSKDLMASPQAEEVDASAPVAAPAPSIAVTVPALVALPPSALSADEITTIAVKGVRKIIAERMLASLQTTAQLTLNSSADARMLQALRKRFKESPEAWGLRGVTINDLVLFATARSLAQHPDLNAQFADNTISQYKHVHLGVAVDTPRGLLVPVVRNADLLTLKQLAAEAKRLAAGAQVGKLNPDELSGGTFTVTNLGSFGVESFTPVLNSPQVAILGVSGISLKGVEGKAKAEAQATVEFVPHIGLSLTINHQVVDGAPAARFLQTLAQAIAQIDLLLAG